MRTTWTGYLAVILGNQANPDHGIGDYALIGDTRTAALVSPTGSIDWMCLPRFDGGPVFGRLVGGDAAGTFAIAPQRPAGPPAHRYRTDSTVLETRWRTDRGEVVVTDGMVADLGHDLLPDHLLVRRIDAAGAAATIDVRFDPRRGRERQTPRVRRVGDALVCAWPGIGLAINSTSATPIGVGETTTFEVEPGRPVIVAVSAMADAPVVITSPTRAWEALLGDEQRWIDWARSCEVGSSYRDDAVRSLLTLRLLTYSPSGAAVAAPTTSLPEEIGGERNWDYRFTWPRDAAIIAVALAGVGRADAASRFLAWLVHTTALDRPRLRALYTLHGGPPPAEREWRGWPGYRASTPVRVGNDARTQHQLDGYGWILDAVSVLDEAQPLTRSTWRSVARFADFAAAHWNEPDAGMWETRSDPAHHVHSKLMSWLALDRSVRLAQRHPTRRSKVRTWAKNRDLLADDVRRHGYDEARGTYTRTYGSNDLDAALLLLPVLEFEDPCSPRVRGTIEAVRNELSASPTLLYRYPPGSDGVRGIEGAFLPCSFWLVQALARTGEIDEATALLDELLPLGGALGLFAEEIDPASGAHLGNFPQALTHAAVLQAILALRSATDRAPARA